MKGKLKSNKAVVNIIGLRYVGLPLAQAFSKSFKVIGFDTDVQKVNQLISRQSETPTNSTISINSMNSSNSTNQLDAIILAVVYDALMEMILDKLKGIMNANPILIDVRGFFKPAEAEEKEFCYVCL